MGPAGTPSPTSTHGAADTGDSAGGHRRHPGAEPVAAGQRQPDGDDHRHRQLYRQHRPGATGWVPDRAARGGRPRPVAAAVPQYVAAMPGGSDLGDTGSWSQAPHTASLVPRVSPGWVPSGRSLGLCRALGLDLDGRRALGLRALALRPLGREWTERWAWSPGEARSPSGRSMRRRWWRSSASAPGSRWGRRWPPSICWVPLGPREPYRPWLRASDQYVRQVNIDDVTNVTTINTTNVTVNNFVNRGAATVVPAAAMTASRPVQAVAQPIGPAVCCGAAGDRATAGGAAGDDRWGDTGAGPAAELVAGATRCPRSE